MNAIKRLRLEQAHNIRDLGGYETEDGKITKWNTVFRSDNLVHLTEHDWKILQTCNIRTIIDLRSLSEVKIQSYTVPENITYIHSPLQRKEINLNNPLESAENAFAKSMMQGYLSIVDTCGDLLANVLLLIVEGLKKGAVLFHCTAGKDRTGVVAAVLLYLLHVSEEDIIADYQVSYTYNKKGINTSIDNHPECDKIKHFLYSKAEDMEELLQHFEEISLEKVLAEHGFDSEKVALLKNMMLEDK